ncbi:hypothetical protein ATO49_16180 [Mycolicibacterium fortuitum subsp. fortuitum DSM 46621 = ATCC 6841 = JCM 6387]|nr:hypothetical protein ATO49_16180 [Mycolicibacterium fortuitum subsp. fortuitum DSM 46621 = ATCC 6841 = JCM 6387]
MFRDHPAAENRHGFRSFDGGKPSPCPVEVPGRWGARSELGSDLRLGETGQHSGEVLALREKALHFGVATGGQG